MAAATPIIDVDVDTSKFDAFLADFEKHKASIGTLPGIWQGIGKSIDASGEMLGQMLDNSDALLLSTKAIAESNLAIVAALTKMGESQGKVNKNVTAAKHEWKEIDFHVRSITKGLAEGAGSLVKWAGITGIMGGLLGVGSLWGIDRLALAAGGARRSALGLGVTSGEQQAFGINFSRVLDNPGGLLEGIANAQNDPREVAPLLALGIKDYGSKDAAQLAPEVLDAIRTRAKSTPSNVLGATADAYGWTKFVSMDEIRRLRSTPDDEWRRLQAQNAANRGGLALDPRTQRAWQDLTTQLTLAGQTIENTLIRGLVPLAGPLGHLSQGVIDVVSALAGSPLIKKWIGEAGDGLETFAKFIQTPEFKADVESFVTHIGDLAKAIGAAFDWLMARIPGATPATSGFGLYGPQLPGKPLSERLGLTTHDQNDFAAWRNADPSRDVGGVETWQERMGLMTAPGGRFQLGDIEKVSHDYFRKNGWNEAQTAGILASMHLESGFRANALNPAGDSGLFQLSGARKQQYVNIFGHAPDQGTPEEQLSFAQYELTHGERATGDRLKGTSSDGDAYDVFRGGFERPSAANLAHDQGIGRALAHSYAERYTVNRSPAPVTVHLDVHNTTGSQFATTGAQAAAP